MKTPIKVGISACLFGERVRYNGENKRDDYLCETLGQHVQWVSLCPEVACGFPTPREAVLLVGENNVPRLLTQETGIDHTKRLLTWAHTQIARLKNENLNGFVFKTKSPSCGLRDIPVYNDQGFPTRKGAGLFTRAVMEVFSHMPCEDERRLHDPTVRKNFIERITMYRQSHEEVL